MRLGSVDTKPIIIILVLFLVSFLTACSEKTPGVYEDKIVLGSVVTLRGELSAPGIRMDFGLNHAFENVTIRGKKIELIVRNDYYDADRARQEATNLIEEGIFAMIGNIGEINIGAVLPLLEQHNIPAVGFLNGSDLTYQGQPFLIQFRPGYKAEIKKLMNALFEQGLQAENVCAYVLQGESGFSVLEGLRDALITHGATNEIIEAYQKVITSAKNNRTSWNNIGPVGTYKLDQQVLIKEGYDSLKNWEASSGHTCKFIVTYGFEANLGNFMRHSMEQNEPWAFSAVSFSGPKRMHKQLLTYEMKPLLFMTQIIPLMQGDVPIVKEFRDKVGASRMTNIGLEAYIIGKWIVKALEDTDPLTQENFLKTLKTMKANVGGVEIDYPANKAYSSSLILVTRIRSKEGVSLVDESDWQLFRNHLGGL